MVAFYDAGRAAQLAINLFHGWGYNFYRVENQLRADDLMVRAKVCEMLGAIRGQVDAAESQFRQQRLPPLSRAHPLPDAEAVRQVAVLEAIGREIGALEGRIRTLPVPENDRMTQRLRREAPTLAALIESDESLVGRAEYLRTLMQPATADWMLENAAWIREELASLGATVVRRGELLTIATAG